MKSERRFFYLLTLVIWGVVFAPSSSPANQRYLCLGGGWVAGGEPDVRTETFGPVQSVTYSGNEGWGLFAAYGRDWQRVRAELETAFRRYKLDAAVAGNTGPRSATTYMEITSLMFNFFYDFRVMDRLEFSIGGGVGGSFYAIDEFTAANYAVDYIPGWDVTCQAVAELNYRLNDRFTLGIRYHFLDAFDTGNENVSDAQDVFASIRYHF